MENPKHGDPAAIDSILQPPHGANRLSASDQSATAMPGCPFHAAAAAAPPRIETAPIGRQKLIAYQVGPNPGYIMEPSPPLRDWMDAAPGKTPYRCLPLVMANQGGWSIRCPCNITATWNGKDHPENLKLTFTDPPAPHESIAVSHFGLGIITFRFPWIFRTAPGIGMWVHGPSNWPKENIAPLQGLVETDWSHLPFTMNWKITKRNTPVYFIKGEPICMLTPFLFDLLESMDPLIVPAISDPALVAAIETGRLERIRTIDRQLSEENKDHKLWEKTYFKGESVEGTKQATHRTNFRLAPFVEKNRADE